MVRRPKVLVSGSYGWRRKLTRDEIALADSLAFEIGRAFVHNDIDILFGGSFDLGKKIIEGARAESVTRNIPLSDRLITYHTANFPPIDGAREGQMYKLRDDDTYWTRLVNEAAAVVAISGRKNSRVILDLARTLHKPVFPLGLFEGAALTLWEQLNDPNLSWLGDLGRRPDGLAAKLAETIVRSHAPEWIAGQVFVIMHFGADANVYETIADECAKLTPKLTAIRADERPESSVIMEDVKRYILKSEFIIVDLSHERPNVYYELGYAHGVGNLPSDILLIAQADASLHFDIAGLRVHRYDSLDALRSLIRNEFALMVEDRRKQGDD
jgi:Sir2- and TIR-associating SLOG family